MIQGKNDFLQIAYLVRNFTINGMRRYFFVGVSCALGFVLWSSCSKGSNNQSSVGSMSATVGSTSFKPQNITVGYDVTRRMIEILGYSITAGDTTQLTILVPDTAALNTPFPFTSGSSLSWYDSKVDFYSGDEIFGHGSVTLNTLDTLTQMVSGTFNGTLEGTTGDTIVVSNGAFNVVY
jgi:hypothetical protein